MANVTITQLPSAGPITGTESVPIVQNGQTVQTTTAAIAASPAQFQTFLTVNQEPTLSNSRYFSVGTGLGIVDNGAQSYFRLTLNAVSGSLESASTGIIAKDSASTVAARTITAGTSGVSLTNGNGVSGNPTISLTGTVLALANLSSTGMLSIGGGSVNARVLTGTVNQIDIANGDGSNNPTFSISSNPVIPGTAGMVWPKGTTAQQPAGVDGQVRFNTDTETFDGYTNGFWRTFALTGGVTSFSAGSTGFSPSTSTSGAVVLSGILNSTNGGTGVNNGSHTITLGGNVVTQDSFTTSGAYGITLTATNTTSLTLPTSGTLATLSGTETLTNKTISGLNNSLSDISNASLVNSSITIGTTSISLGNTSLTLGGLTSVAVTQDPVSALQLATKQYVDAIAEGLHVHASCAAATTGTLASITGGTVTYNNGTAGVGATLTLSVALSVLDGYTLQNGDRVLVKNEATQANNGIYTWATGGTVLTRATDFDTATEIASGDFTFVTYGTLYADTGWVQTNPVITVGTSPIIFTQFSGAGTYTAGTGLTLIGTQFSITNTGVSASTYGSASSVPVIAVNAQGQITSATNTSIAIAASQITSGTIDSARISGSYTGITGVGTLSAGTWNASTISAAYGGTGQSTYATGDILYASGATALSKLTLGTQGYVLKAGATAPEWGAVDGGTF